MKKLIGVFAVICAASFANAVQVGWSMAGANNYVGDAYNFFIVGQKGVTEVATITSLLNAGSSVSSYAIGSGKIASNGAASVAYGSSGVSIDNPASEQNYTGFFVVFNSADPTSGSAKYVVVSGAQTLTKTIGSSTASVTFAAQNQADLLNDKSKWSNFGEPSSDIPEPTTGILMLVGVAGLALRRRRA